MDPLFRNGTMLDVLYCFTYTSRKGYKMDAILHKGYLWLNSCSENHHIQDQERRLKQSVFELGQKHNLKSIFLDGYRFVYIPPNLRSTCPEVCDFLRTHNAT